MCSAPTEIRTPVLALKGLRPSPLDDGGHGWAADSCQRYDVRRREAAHIKAGGFYHSLMQWSSNLLFFVFCALGKKRH